MNWRCYVDENGEVRFKDWSDWAIYDRPVVSILSLWADDPKSNFEEIGDRVFIERDPKSRNTG